MEKKYADLLAELIEVTDPLKPEEIDSIAESIETVSGELVDEYRKWTINELEEIEKSIRSALFIFRRYGYTPEQSRIKTAIQRQIWEILGDFTKDGILKVISCGAPLRHLINAKKFFEIYNINQSIRTDIIQTLENGGIILSEVSKKKICEEALLLLFLQDWHDKKIAPIPDLRREVAAFYHNGKITFFENDMEDWLKFVNSRRAELVKKIVKSKQKDSQLYTYLKLSAQASRR